MSKKTKTILKSKIYVDNDNLSDVLEIIGEALGIFIEKKENGGYVEIIINETIKSSKR